MAAPAITSFILTNVPKLEQLQKTGQLNKDWK